MKHCEIFGCFKDHYSSNLCRTHYDKKRRHGDVFFERKIARGLPCTIQGCTKAIWINNMCDMHDRRQKRHGDPLFVNPKCNRDGNYKIRALAKSASWKSENRHLNNSFNNARKSKMRKARLSSVTIEDLAKVYMSCPKDFVVDHIIPINHRDVCGLHVPWNLQYLTVQDNAKKSNKFDGMYENNSWKQFPT